MTIGIRIKQNLRYLSTKQLDRDIDKSVRQAVNRTAFDVRKSTQNKLNSWLELTRRFLPNTVIVEQAQSKPVARVGFSTTAGDIPNLLERGGVRTKPNAKNVSVPVGVKRTSRGGISRANRPPALLRKKKHFIGRLWGKLALWKEVRGGDIDMLYILKPFTKYKGRDIQFIVNAERVVETKYARNLLQQLDRNIRKSVNK